MINALRGLVLLDFKGVAGRQDPRPFNRDSTVYKDKCSVHGLFAYVGSRLVLKANLGVLRNRYILHQT